MSLCPIPCFPWIALHDAHFQWGSWSQMQSQSLCSFIARWLFYSTCSKQWQWTPELHIQVHQDFIQDEHIVHFNRGVVGFYQNTHEDQAFKDVCKNMTSIMAWPMTFTKMLLSSTFLSHWVLGDAVLAKLSWRIGWKPWISTVSCQPGNQSQKDQKKIRCIIGGFCVVGDGNNEEINEAGEEL